MNFVMKMQILSIKLLMTKLHVHIEFPKNVSPSIHTSLINNITISNVRLFRLCYNSITFYVDLLISSLCIQNTNCFGNIGSNC